MVPATANKAAGGGTEIAGNNQIGGHRGAISRRIYSLEPTYYPSAYRVQSAW
jgi:hypothetical protein